MEVPIPEETWEGLWVMSQESLYIVYNCQIFFTTLLHFYYSSSKLSQFDPSSHLGSCPRCGTRGVTTLHMLWHCPRLHRFWTVGLRYIEVKSKVHIPNCPLATIMHITEGWAEGVRRAQMIFVHMAFPLATNTNQNNLEGMH